MIERVQDRRDLISQPCPIAWIRQTFFQTTLSVPKLAVLRFDLLHAERPSLHRLQQILRPLIDLGKFGFDLALHLYV